MDDLKILQQILEKLESIETKTNKIDKIEKDITEMKLNLKDMQSDMKTEFNYTYEKISELQTEVKDIKDNLSKRSLI